MPCSGPLPTMPPVKSKTLAFNTSRMVLYSLIELLQCHVSVPLSRLSPRFKYRVVNYAKVYYACGHCDGSGNSEGQMEFGPYAISKSLTPLNVTKPDPKIKVEEVTVKTLSLQFVLMFFMQVKTKSSCYGARVWTSIYPLKSYLFSDSILYVLSRNKELFNKCYIFQHS